MKIKEILQYLQVEEIIGSDDVQITGLCTDSRRVKEGDLFFCYGGENFDSHEVTGDAVKNGAVALVCEKKCDLPVTQIVVGDGRAQIAHAARAFYGFPDKNLKIVGVTGTNGKTTTTYILNEIFTANGNKTGLIGTLGIFYGEKRIAPELTTPDPVYLYSVFADMVKNGVEYVFMEVSAHALYYDKINGINFEVGIFTNLTQDHLDFFGTMEAYAESKKLMFANGRCKYAVLNSDDGLGIELLSCTKNSFGYGLDNPADVFAVGIKESVSGTEMILNLFDELYEVKINIPGIHNVYNALAAATCAKLLGVKINTISAGLANLKRVSGRLERVASFGGGEIFVDFAHTPDGLEKSLKTLKKLCTGKLVCLFGCGGNRDKTKRPVMGKTAAEIADFCVVTSDNPRYEDPHDIIFDIEKGIRETGKEYVTVTDRESATEYAIRLLGKGDILLVAGKGGEDYQEIMGIKHAYNDNKIIQKIIG